MYLFKNIKKIRITIAIAKTVLIIKFFLSSTAVSISLVCSVTKIYPTTSPLILASPNVLINRLSPSLTSSTIGSSFFLFIIIFFKLLILELVFKSFFKLSLSANFFMFLSLISSSITISVFVKTLWSKSKTLVSAIKFPVIS